MARTLFIPFSGVVQFDETGVVGDVVSFAVGSGPWAGSTAQITGTTLTALHAIWPDQNAEFNLTAPLPLEIDSAGILYKGWLNDTNLEALVNGVPSAHQTYRAVFQLSGSRAQWFGNTVYVNGTALSFNVSLYTNGLSYPNGEMDFTPDGGAYSDVADSETPTIVNGYFEDPSKGQYVFVNFRSLTPGVWEPIPESIDGPYRLSDDTLYDGNDPLSITVDCAKPYGQPPCGFQPFGDGVGTIDDPSSEDNMTGAKGFKRNKGFTHKNGFTAKNGFTKENGF